MKAYAEKIAEQPVSNPIAQQTTQATQTTNNNNKSGYTGYIPSSDPAPIKPEPQQVAVQPAQQQAKKAEDEMTPEMKALLKRADRVIANGSRYLNLK